MKILRWVVLMAVLIFLPTISYPATLGGLRISFIEGDAQVNTEDTGDWVPASINMPLKDGDRIWVPEGSRIELQLRDGTALRLDEKTAFDVLTLEKNSFQFYLPEGRVYANFKGLRDTVLQIDTPMSSVRAHDRAIFRIDLLDDRSTDISVYMGSVTAENQDGRLRVDQDRTLALRDGLPTELGPIGPPDAWEEWNRNRNQKYAYRRAPSRYLPEELSPYSNDFEDNGRWVYVREYGHVWTPTIVVSAGWAPYRLGRWVWIRGDYVWISYEPWGWVPYHYGRWAFVASFGWCWVPPARGAVYWGPGFVGWVRTPTHVSWVPLAPREIYYGHGYYGPHSINITNININTINVGKIVYRNVHVHNAVTIVHHDTFVHGRHVEVRERENPFLRERIHIGRPNIKPERTTVMPVVREIPQVRRPPEKVQEIKVREVKERRPLVKEREVSVLRPEFPPREMTIKRREGGPVEKGIDRVGERPAAREMEKGRDRKISVRKAEKTIDRKPSERVEKQIERTPQPGVERPRKDRKPIELERDKSKDRSTLDRKSGTTPEREIQKPSEQRRQEGERQIQKELKPEQKMEKQQEIKPSTRGMDRPGQPVPSGSLGNRPPDSGPSQVMPPSRGDQRSDTRLERPPVREIDKSRQASPPPSQSVRPPVTSQGRGTPPPTIEQRPEPRVARRQEIKPPAREQRPEPRVE
ncbi:MAG: iron dicitrate transport regulator FecR [Deltaproteobacteria bacterium]|nr:iron dicitrate transport regulator FecR [Deltaproteobacteria bacterium]